MSSDTSSIDQNERSSRLPILGIKMKKTLEFEDFQKTFIFEKNKLEKDFEISSEIQNKSETSPNWSKYQRSPLTKMTLIKNNNNQLRNSLSLLKNINVRKFVHKIKTSAHMHKLIMPNVALLLNDASYFISEKIPNFLVNFGNMLTLVQKKAEFLSSFILFGKMIKLFQFVYNFETFHPFGKIKIIWDIFLVFNSLLLFFYIPLTLSFKSIFNENHIQSFNIFQFSIYLFDICLNFNTGYIDNGVMVKERVKVWKQYLKSGLIFDLIAVSSLVIKNDEFNGQSWNAADQKISLFQMLFFVRVRNFRNRFAKIKEFFCLDSKHKGVLDLCLLLLTSLLFSHFFACLFHLVAIDSSNKQTWLNFYSINKKSIYEQYLYALYWSTVTLMTVGYGDITPQNSEEIAITLVTVLCGCFVFGYNINKIANIFQDMNRQNDQIQEKINKINIFMENKGINANLQMRIRAYLKFFWKNQNDQLNQELLDMISSLSESLKEELYLQSYGEVIKNYFVLAENFSEKFLCELITHMEEQIFMKSEIIFQEKDSKNNFFYFLVSGEIELFHQVANPEKPPLILTKLHEKSAFGELSFLTGKNHAYSAKATQYSKVYKISHDKLLEVLGKFPEDYEKYCELRDKINLYQNYNDLKLRCFICNKKDHLCDICNLVHYSPNKELILLRHIFSENQERQNLSLIRRKKTNALLTKNKIKGKIKKLKNLLPMESDDNFSDPNMNSEKLMADLESLEQKKSSLDPNDSINYSPEKEKWPPGIKKTMSSENNIPRLCSIDDKKSSKSQNKDLDKSELIFLGKFSNELEIEVVRSFSHYFEQENIENFIEKYRFYRKDMLKESKRKTKEKSTKPRKSGYSFLGEVKSPVMKTAKEIKQPKTPICKKGYFTIENVNRPLNFLSLIQEIKDQKTQKKSNLNH